MPGLSAYRHAQHCSGRQPAAACGATHQPFRKTLHPHAHVCSTTLPARPQPSPANPPTFVSCESESAFHQILPSCSSAVTHTCRKRRRQAQQASEAHPCEAHRRGSRTPQAAPCHQRRDHAWMLLQRRQRRPAGRAGGSWRESRALGASAHGGAAPTCDTQPLTLLSSLCASSGKGSSLVA